MEETFTELESVRDAGTDDAKTRRKELAEQVTIQLVRHSFAEEVLVYPQVEKKVSSEEADHARKEHAEAEETLQRLEKLDDAEDPALDNELPPSCARSAITLRMRKAKRFLACVKP